MPSPIFIVTVATLCGLCLGSFLNVVAYRLPAGVSLVAPGSSCPTCGTAIRPYDNVPVFSWLALRGHCRDCHTSISPSYPLTELVTAVLFAGVTIVRGGSSSVWLDLVFVAALVAITLIDLEHRIIPDLILAPLAAIALALTAIFSAGDLPAHLIAAVAGGGLFLVASVVYPGGMGMGDVKLVTVMGLVLGASLAPALLIALLSGSLFGVAIIARRGVSVGRRTAVPFGPFLALGGLIAVLVGPELVHFYLHTFAR